MSKAAAAANAVEKALPFIEEAAAAIAELVMIHREKKKQKETLKDEIGALVSEIEGLEKWYKDNSRPIPKLGGSIVTAIKDAVARVMTNIHDRKITKLAEEATHMRAYRDYLIENKGAAADAPQGAGWGDGFRGRPASRYGRVSGHVKPLRGTMKINGRGVYEDAGDMDGWGMGPGRSRPKRRESDMHWNPDYFAMMY